ncbi:four helix bundle protein [Nafulsella turpanensis]|uniref:four helix bundle protein n=1 Tax=Nafulsella turpanensis TaxID=1265690 RepID=UPI00036CE233|nr:four helix bundle protein [Nafulsella turpanensis]
MINYKELKVWDLSHQLVLQVHRITLQFPKEEAFSFTQQIRRSAISVPSNIAEGCGRSSDKDLVRFLHISMGSANELEYQLLLTKDLNYLPEEDYQVIVEKLIQIKKMLNSFISKIKNRTQD